MPVEWVFAIHTELLGQQQGDQRSKGAWSEHTQLRFRCSLLDLDLCMQGGILGCVITPGPLLAQGESVFGPQSSASVLCLASMLLVTDFLFCSFSFLLVSQKLTSPDSNMLSFFCFLLVLCPLSCCQSASFISLLLSLFLIFHLACFT